MLLLFPAFIKMAVVFSLILLLGRYKVPLSLCLFSAAGIIGVWMGQPPLAVGRIIIIKSLSGEGLWLSLVVIEIIVLSRLLNEARQMERIVTTLKAISPGSRFTLASLPAIIGLLPMPGGALFSAPMVEASAENIKLSPELKTAINYWFRHIWEYWWPLYPGILLAISILDIEPWRLIIAQFPLCLGVLIAGNIFLLSKVPKGTSNTSCSRQDIKKFLWEIIPFGLVVVTMLGLNCLINWLDPPTGWPRYLNFLIGIIFAQGWVFRTNGLSLPILFRLHFDRSTINLAMIILGILAFKGVLIESHIISGINEELAGYHIPLTLVVAILPFVAGLATGIALGFVGSSYPLIVTLLQGQVQNSQIFIYSILAYGFGYMGMMMSPVHLCLVVSKDYFHADLAGSYRLLLKPMIFVLIWTTLLFMVGKMIL